MRVLGTSGTATCLWIPISTLKVFRGFGQHHLGFFSVPIKGCAGVDNTSCCRFGFNGFRNCRTAFTIYEDFRHTRARG